jgi:hypothetical protein
MQFAVKLHLEELESRNVYSAPKVSPFHEQLQQAFDKFLYAMEQEALAASDLERSLPCVNGVPQLTPPTITLPQTPPVQPPSPPPKKELVVNYTPMFVSPAPIKILPPKLRSGSRLDLN